LFSGDLFVAKLRKGRPVEGDPARYELELFVGRNPPVSHRFWWPPTKSILSSPKL